MLVRASGSISVYPRRGTYQLICETLTLAGQGNLLLMIEERKRKLAAEGLFDPERKRSLPLLPARVAVVTSPTGAAIRDILRVLARRAAGVDVVVLPAPVQGEGAAERLAAQIRTAGTYRLGDVIIVGRGGGSLEDLMPFYEEVTARAVAESPIPVISAVGHEVDFALTDLAADVRAPTPSAAAELVSASRLDLLRRVAELTSGLRSEVSSRVQRARDLLQQFTADSLQRSFRTLLQPRIQRVDDAREDLIYAVRERLRDARHRLELRVGALEGVSPLGILERGYAVVRRSDNGAVLRTTAGVAKGDLLNVRLHRGRLTSKVEEIQDHEEL
jgi:exodeoxyribonuclease VII large subunit